MRNTKRVDLGGGRMLAVRELTVLDVKEIFYALKGLDSPTEEDIVNLVLERLPLCIEDGTPALVESLSFSELALLYPAWEEVNASFFALCEKLGLDRAVRAQLGAARASITGGSAGPSPASSGPATSGPGNTGSSSSSPPSRPRPKPAGSG